MDSAWHRSIAELRGANGRMLTGGKDGFRALRRDYLDMISMVPHHRGIFDDTTARPAATAVAPALTQADYDLIQGKLYFSTRLLMTDALKDLHAPGHDPAVTEGAGSALWRRLEACYGDASLTADDHSSVLADLQGMAPLHDRGFNHY